MKGHEFYPTPDDLAEYLWQRFLWIVPNDHDLSTALEPSAGRGAFARAMSRSPRVASVTAIEPFEDEPKGLPENVEWGTMTLEDLHTALDGDRPFDAAVGNPPFSLAEEHLRLLFRVVRQGGYVGFLLRAGFLASSGRAPFFVIHPPKHVFVLSRRPSFVWSHTCRGCKHNWSELPGIQSGPCPECGATDVSTSMTDRYDYIFGIWEVGWQGKTELSWLANIPGIEA
jgi:hypothetical protein